MSPRLRAILTEAFYCLACVAILAAMAFSGFLEATR